MSEHRELDAAADSPDFERWARLLVTYFDGDTAEPLPMELEQELAAHPEFRRLFVEMASQRVALQRMFRGEDAAAAESNSGEAASPAVVSGWRSRATATFSRPVVWSILAASLIFAGYVVLISWNMLGKQLASNPDRTGAAVATIRNSEEVEWSEDSKSPLAPGKAPKGYPGAGGEGSAIAQNQQLQITSGVVELQLKQGTTLFIEGPADWQITGENSATLTHGKLVAKVPQQAVGFTLETPTAKIIDLGTEFGVEVNQQGTADVHVVKGVIDVQSAKGSAKSSPGELKAGQSARITQTGASVEKNAGLPDKFKRLVGAGQQPTESDPGYEVLFHYRLGEDDKNAKAGELAAEQALGTGVLGSSHSLTRVGKPTYTGQTPNADSKLALSLAGGSEAEGYVGKEFTDLPIDNCVLEAWVRPRSLKQHVIVYLGNPSYNGYGLILESGKWQGLHGSLESIATTDKPQVSQWTHLAWVRERGHIQLFVNGAPSGPESIASCKAPEATVHIGHAPGTLSQTFDGEIDEVRLIRLKSFFRSKMLLYELSDKKQRP